MKWIRNTAGKPDATLTFAVAFGVIALGQFAIGGSTLDLGGLHLEIPRLDGAGVAALLGTLAAYVKRRADHAKSGTLP